MNPTCTAQNRAPFGQRHRWRHVDAYPLRALDARDHARARCPHCGYLFRIPGTGLPYPLIAVDGLAALALPLAWVVFFLQLARLFA